MRNLIAGSALLALSSSFAFSSALHAAEPVRIGVITSLSGPAAHSGAQMKAGIDTWLRLNGATAGGRKIEVLYRDDTGPQADVAKRLATELVSRDKADILAGFIFTPNAMAAASVADRAKRPLVVMNAAASGITKRSPYVTRTSYTIAQSVVPLAQWAHKTGSRKVYSIVADYAPGLDGEEWFDRTFKAAGGTIVGAVRAPLATVDYSAYVQRIKDAKPDAVHVFLPNGQPMVSFMKAWHDKGLHKANIRFLGGEGWADQDVLTQAGDGLQGIYTAGFYAYSRPGADNERFRAAFAKTVNGKFEPNFLAASAYDGMALIAATLAKTGGKTDGPGFMKALKGYSAPSPRGTVTIDAATNDIVQTIYIRRIERRGDAFVASEIDRYDAVKDPVKN
ncbi:ABC transporter substrate-binding protein [Pseudoduganella albidiflava]|uniref:ABC transporter substrate-binding protein n=1 Tax=Pseudoduganella albidiflava TaxID=321983 RepID=A0AA87XRB4_9BURK|nr:ABC transporter substrate-binding protein [Pseudoduganella albidiflava]GGY37856.1 ABC transporter substrate-binding protein [Pseudoduganella albidiflava]